MLSRQKKREPLAGLPHCTSVKETRPETRQGPLRWRWPELCLCGRRRGRRRGDRGSRGDGGGSRDGVRNRRRGLQEAITEGHSAVIRVSEEALEVGGVIAEGLPNHRREHVKGLAGLRDDREGLSQRARRERGVAVVEGARGRRQGSAGLEPSDDVVDISINSRALERFRRKRRPVDIVTSRGEPETGVSRDELVASRRRS